MDIKKARTELIKGKTIYDMNLRVGYYGRVSTDKDDQLNSLENQKKYFEDMITKNENWTFIKGYLDEGISGTAVKNRDAFLKMVEDATLGKIDLILTKEISRFSRNTIDSIQFCEYLLKNGVIVYFLSDNINTIYPDSEFRLTMMSSLAQDEVRKLSERVKFGIRQMIKDGKLVGGNLTGYFKKNGKYEINPKESPIIEYLFTTYVSGNTTLKKISEELANMGYTNTKGKNYSTTTLAKFLKNPRYKGYYTANLTEVEDYKTHKKKKIPKEKQIIYKDDKIPAIISEEIWDKANKLYEKRKKHPSRHILNTEKHIKEYKYSCKLYCKKCKTIFIRNGGSNRINNPIWSCKTYKTKGVKACASPNIKEKDLDKIFIELFTSLIKKKKNYISSLTKEYKTIIKKNSLDLNQKEAQINNIKKQKDKLLDLNMKGMIDDYEFKKRNDAFNLEIKKLQEKQKKKENNNIEEIKWKKIENQLYTKLDIKKNLAYLIDILIEKVEIEKIKEDRKNIKLKIYYTFNAPNQEINLNMNKKTHTS